LEWAEKNLAAEFCRNERRGMVDMAGCELPVSTQADIPGLNRTSLYYKPEPPGEYDLYIKAGIDRLYTDHPEYGYRRVTDRLNFYVRP
jgi:putative transposase